MESDRQVPGATKDQPHSGAATMRSQDENSANAAAGGAPIAVRGHAAKAPAAVAGLDQRQHTMPAAQAVGQAMAPEEFASEKLLNLTGRAAYRSRASRA